MSDYVFRKPRTNFETRNKYAKLSHWIKYRNKQQKILALKIGAGRKSS